MQTLSGVNVSTSLATIKASDFNTRTIEEDEQTDDILL
jgi:hypothetical protein